jgi:20S proteasome alpha/beta subunit
MQKIKSSLFAKQALSLEQTNRVRGGYGSSVYYGGYDTSGGRDSSGNYYKYDYVSASGQRTYYY